jgi:hypothetical protein
MTNGNFQHLDVRAHRLELELLLQIFFGQVSLPRVPDPERIDQCEKFPQIFVPAYRLEHGGVQGLERYASRFAMRVRPNRRILPR